MRLWEEQQQPSHHIVYSQTAVPFYWNAMKIALGFPDLGATATGTIEITFDRAHDNSGHC